MTVNNTTPPIVYLILKRLRSPLILLIIAYTVATAGMTIIPGVDAEGNTVHLSIFQSFYFITYVATTIGFGEIPYEFTDAQRLWVVFCIYLTVISWLVAIGNIISLLQDPGLKTVWKKQRFTKQVKRINKKFFIIGGYGETGELLVESLSKKGYQCVVIDSDAERINLLDLNSSVYGVPFLEGDASDVETLKMAGLENENCRALLAVTNNDKVNVKMAVSAKLLRSSVRVVCRVDSKEARANAKSFDTDHVVDPYRIYAESIGQAFRTPSIQQLIGSLLLGDGSDYVKQLNPPKGHWIICGNNRFSEEMLKFLDYEGMDYTLITDDESINSSHVHGRGTEAVTLRAAGIDRSVGIVAGTRNDTDNFSIIMTARHLKPNLYLLAKQNLESNRLIFQNASIDSVMESSRLMTSYILPLVTQPHMANFLRLARHQSEDWGKSLMAKLKEVSDTVPSTYLIKIVLTYLQSGNILRLQDLYVPDRDNPDRPIALPLMLIRNGKEELLPKLSTAINSGDIYLMASRKPAQHQITYTINHEQDFHYVIHGEEKPVSIVMHKIREYLKQYKLSRRHKRMLKHKEH